MLKALVIRSTGKWYKVKTADGVVIETRLKGKMRLKGLKSTNPVAVGDIVNLEQENETSDWMIASIQERKNYIIRQSPKKKMATHILASNLDQAFVLASMSNQRTSSGFIDRFLVTAEAYHIPSCIIFNKQDVLSEKDMQKQHHLSTIYADAGYPTYFVSALTGEGMAEIDDLMKDKVTLLCGHSGVGKSTFANALDSTLDLKTKAISNKYGKGVHTTTFAELFELPNGGSIIDIPGIKEFGVIEFEQEEVCHYFPEMRDLIGQCKFNDCKHLQEPGCEVKEQLEAGTISYERYLNYINILEDIDEAREY